MDFYRQFVYELEAGIPGIDSMDRALLLYCFCNLKVLSLLQVSAPTRSANLQVPS